MYLAIDIGGTFIKYCAINDEIRLFAKGKVSTPQGSIEALYEVIDQIFDRVTTNYPVTGIAISSPGAVTDNGVVEGVSALEYLHGPNIKQDLQQRYGLAVSIENDANCAAIAEMKAGSGKGLKDVIFLVCGTGIGGAIIKNGQIHKGRQIHAGELGMMVHYYPETDSVESFSQLCATASLVRRASEKVGRSLSGQEVFSLAEQGDKICQQEIHQFYRHLATLLTNLQCVYDPELIVFSGGITDREDFGEELETHLQEMNKLRGYLAIDTRVTVARFKNDANLIGAYFHHISQ